MPLCGETAQRACGENGLYIPADTTASWNFANFRGEKRLFKGTSEKEKLDSTSAPKGPAVFSDATTCHSACSALISCLLLFLDVG